jgi:hypothetical protein
VSRRALAFAVLLGASGCTQSFDGSTLGVPVTMAGAPGEAVTGTPFKVNTHTVHAFWGLIPLAQADLQKALARQLVGGQQVAQLKIKIKSRWSDVLLTALTLGVVAPRTVTYEGVIIGR